MDSRATTTEEIRASFIHKNIEQHKGDPNYNIISDFVLKLSQNGGIFHKTETRLGWAGLAYPSKTYNMYSNRPFHIRLILDQSSST